MMRVRSVVGAGLVLLLPAMGVHAASRAASLPDAAKARDRAAVASLLKQRADVNVPQPDGTTALHWAAHWNDFETADLLIRAGAKVDVTNEFNSTPLSLACENGNARMITRLIDAGADPSAMPSGEPPILTAALTGNLDAVKVLIARGANVNAKETWRGQTALMWAAAENHPDIAKLLIEKGADINAQTPGGFSPLLFAVRQGSMESVRLLVEAGANVNEVFQGKARGGMGASSNPRTAIVVAMLNHNYEVAAYLLSKGADPKSRDKIGYTPLHHLIEARNPGNDIRRETIGDVASIELMQALIKAGADPNARRDTEVRRFAQEKYLLIDTGTNMGGITPFLLAAKLGDLEAMRTLLAGGATPTDKTFENDTALLLAAGIGWRENADAGMRTEDEFLAVVRFLVDVGLDVNATNDHRQSVAHGPVYRGMPRLLQLVAEKGARLDLKDEVGRTPSRLAQEGFNQMGTIRRVAEAALLAKLSGEVNP